MTRFVLALVLAAALLAPAADAQGRRSGGGAPAYGVPMHKAEIFFVGGYAWTFSVRAQNGLQYGDLDIKDTGWYGGGIDFQVRPGGFLTLLYRRQDATYTFHPDVGPKVDIDTGSVDYFQIGGQQGVPRGKAFPFGSLTLGASRFSADSYSDDYWKFSVIPGLGVKYYASPRLGIRLQADLPISFTGGGVGFGCGGGGCGTSFYGTGITQLDVGGGLFLMF